MKIIAKFLTGFSVLVFIVVFLTAVRVKSFAGTDYQVPTNFATLSDKLSILRALMYVLVSLALVLTSCGGDGGVTSPPNTGIGQVKQFSGVSAKTAVLRTISITPSNPRGINSGTKLQFNARGSSSDNSVQDLTTLVLWTSSDTSVATISNTPDSKGQAIAISRGYCSISATLGSISSSIIIGVN